MAKVIWTEPALQELDAIAEYIALDNPAAAGQLIEEVFDKVERLEDFPQSGRTPPELPDSVYRVVVVPPGRIFSREEGGRVFVLYIMREERQLRAFMLRAANPKTSDAPG
ncbi:type II toxin-antitoxin system RelE/ParE family toxin [Billgrantia montanilacus]|uniref:Type II toxin-antitoxin system RelE/ParE family toxin n=1 Tax=Billgrantia montanilacus TaxID=2282305 RepID=A0A368TP83_9GAMM|nr:type II toxin-antitoxin system RelE/ParE family toxin [Halomonas montanilacus]RCV86499.1 type II toxin-antitoxin system RelE/ParE family toxin [Halomonas montanilacus]